MKQASQGRPRRGVKIILIVLAALALLAGGGLIALKIMLASDDFQARIKQMVSEQAAEKAGLKVEIDGKFSVSLFPGLGLSTGRVEVSRLPGRETGLPLREMELAEADIQVGLWSLLYGRVEVKSVNLREVRAIADMPQGQSLRLHLNRVRISELSASNGRAEIEGQLMWGRNKVEAEIDMGLFLDRANALEADFTAARLRAALEGRPEIDLVLEGRLALEADFSQLREFRQIERIRAFGFKVSGAGLEAALEGDFSPAALSGQGRLAAGGSLREALAWLGCRLASSQAGADLRLEASGSSDGKVITLSALNASLDSLKLQSQASLTLSRLLLPEQARLTGSLDLGRINLDDYQLIALSPPASPQPPPPSQSHPRTSGGGESYSLPEDEPAAERAGPEGAVSDPAPPAPAASGREETARPLDLLALLRRAEAEIALSGEQAALAGFKFTDIKGRIQGEKGVWRLSHLSLNFLAGRIEAAAAADLKPVPPLFSLDLKAEGLDLSGLSPALKQGRLQSLRANLSASGSDLVAGLNGAASFRVEKMAAVLPLPGELTRILPGQLQLDYASADFNIRRGIANTANLLSEGAGLKAAGQGSLNLPRQSMDMRVLVNLPLGIKLLGSAGVPLIISGPLNNPKVSVDEAELAREAGRAIIDNQITEGLGRENADRIREGVGGLLRGLGR
ncbi:MAG: hypothetical protein LBJ14_07185 [Desulfarculales bacterium]|jgi:AsmA protein|nr:hypothetical protein [Desulfarculales bacterium]